MRKFLLVFVVAALLLLCACKPDGSQSTVTTEGEVPNTTDLILDPNKDWEGDIDLVDDTTEDNIEDDTTEDNIEDDTTGNAENNPGVDEKPEVPENTTEGEPFDPDFPIDVVDPEVTTEPNQDQNNGSTDEPNQGGNSGGNTEEPNQGGNSGGNTEEPNQGGNSGGNTEEPNQGGNSSGNTDEPNQGGNSGGNTEEPNQGGNSIDNPGKNDEGGIELPIIPG